MARNRKNHSAAVRFGPALKALLLCAFIGGSGLGYVWQKNQIHDLARQIKKREIRLQELRSENKGRRDQLSRLRSPQFLHERVRELNLGLGLPSPTQKIVLIVLPVEARVESSGQTPDQLAGRGSDFRPVTLQ